MSMSSGAGIGGNYSLGAYGAAKAGVINLMETVATEYGLYGIRANAVTPGPTATAPMLAWAESQPGGAKAHAADLDLGRLSQPDEVANTVLWLASDLSSNITGTCIRSNIRAASRRPAAGLRPCVRPPSKAGRTASRGRRRGGRRSRWCAAASSGPGWRRASWCRRWTQPQRCCH